MTRWEAFETVCRCLRATLLERGEPPPLNDASPELMIEISSFHYVTPALAWGLKSRPDVPAKLGEFLDAILLLNGKRNAGMLAGLTKAIDALNRIGIEPIPLKGAAYLLDGIYPDPSARFFGDLDMLVPAERSTDAFAALQGAGFATKPEDVILPPGHHHLPMLHDRDTGAGVELHTDVLIKHFDPAITTAWFCERARPAQFNGRSIRLPDATRSVAHCIIHSQLFHNLNDRIELRRFLDSALIRTRHESEIDWDEIDHRLSNLKFGQGLATYLMFAEHLFGQKAPTLSQSPKPDAVADLRAVESRDHFQAWATNMKKIQDSLQSQLSLMTAERNSLRGEIERANAEHDRLQSELGAMTTARAAAQTEIGQLRRSRSWRLTQPLRAAATVARRLIGR